MTKEKNMKDWKTAVLLVAAIGAATPSFAGDLDAVVTTVVQPVTLSSTSQPTYASYDVTLTNTKPNPISGVRFIGTTQVVNGGPTLAPFHSSSPGVACTPTNASQTAISCPIAQLLPGTSGAVSFRVTFNAPVAGERIDFVWSAVFDESGGGASDGDAGTQSTMLAPPDDNNVSSVVPEGGDVTLSTGSSSGVATPSDTWTTTVTVPAGAAATTASVGESVSTVTCAPDLLTCSTSTLTIPGTFANLVITLRRDASTIARGARIDSARIFYQPDSNNPSLGNEVLSCDDPSFVNRTPTAGNPCIDFRKAYGKKSLPRNPVPAGYEGDWEFVIKAIDNGKYVN
jgi:hypothetical protein